MKERAIKCIMVLAVTAMCLSCIVMAVFATTTITDPQTPAGSFPVILSETPPDYSQLTLTELFDRVSESRQALLDSRLGVVREANDAKQRLEGLLRGGRQSTQSTDVLRRDLDTIREAQRVLATILSDILNATTGEEPGFPGSLNQVRLSGNVTGSGPQTEIIPSREYLESLIMLYDEKTQQLARIAESLNGVVPVM